jgi:hypothetical protein
MPGDKVHTGWYFRQQNLAESVVAQSRISDVYQIENMRIEDAMKQ